MHTAALLAMGLAAAGAASVKVIERQVTPLASHLTTKPPYDAKVNDQRYFVVEYLVPQNHNDSFNASLKTRKFPTLDSCTLLIDLPVGTASGNHSFGALCQQKQEHKLSRRILICNDEMIGHFALEPATKNVGKDQLIEFIATNCYGG